MPLVYRPGHPLANENGMVARELAGALPGARSALAGPAIISDGIALRSMVDGRIYTSKAALRRSYRERGYVEVGNEALTPPARTRVDRSSIRAAVRSAARQVGMT
jgi:hypothetical protein